MPEMNKGQTTGIMASVACPWCGLSLDLRELYAQTVLEKGATVTCDDPPARGRRGGCGRIIEVVAIDTRPRVILRQRH